MSKRSVILFVLALLLMGVGISIYLQRVNQLRSTPNSPSDRLEQSADPQRIICAAPNIVETLYALGEERRIVAVSDFVTYPPEALKIGHIGGIIDPNFERILKLKPDLVIIQGAMQKHRDFCQDKNIPLLRVDMESIASIYEGIRTIGMALNCSEKAEKLIREKTAILDEIRQKASLFVHKPTVFICLGRRERSLTSLFTVHSFSFIDELLTIAGGVNIFADAQGRYPQISKEALLQRNPEIILELHAGEDFTPQSVKGLKKDWDAMPLLSATASGQIHIVTDDYMMVSGPRLNQTAQKFYEILHASNRPE